MRLGADLKTSALRDLADEVRLTLDRHLSAKSARPLAVALSGGGDSLALLHMASAWAKNAGRPLLALTVDHGLNADSPRWTAACQRLAAAQGARFEALHWDGPKPATGLPAAARAARHRLLAEAARDAGARVVLLGHTADDLLEAELMRRAGASTPSPSAWAPSPAWPEGRGVFLLRPLLGVRRQALRTWLAARGESWIEDPANLDPAYARSRARRTITAGMIPPTPAPPFAIPLAEAVEADVSSFRLPRRAYAAAPEPSALRLLSIACVCAGGGARPPAPARVAALAARLRAGGPVVATLAGARVTASEGEILVCREAGEVARGGLASLDLPVGQAVVWDGRFRLKAARAGLSVRRLAGQAGQLPPRQRKALQRLPAAARGGLPVLVEPSGRVTCPLLEEAPGVKVKDLTAKRLRAAAGLIGREPR